MKMYNKLPARERKRQLEYSYKQTERQEELALKKELMRLEKMKQQAESFDSEKDRIANEVYEKLLKRR